MVPYYNPLNLPQVRQKAAAPPGANSADQLFTRVQKGHETVALALQDRCRNLEVVRAVLSGGDTSVPGAAWKVG